MTFNEIEEMYRSYPRIKDKLLMLEPNNTQILSFAPGGNDGESKIEKMAIARAEFRGRLKLIQKCLKQLTHDERLFVEYRYIRNDDILIVATKMNWAEREIYRLRKSVIAKTIWFLSLDSKIGYKCS